MLKEEYVHISDARLLFRNPQESSTDDSDKSLFVSPPLKENGWTTTKVEGHEILRGVRDGPLPAPADLESISFKCHSDLRLPDADDTSSLEAGGSIEFVNVVSR